MPTTAHIIDYKKLLSEVIRKQIMILGPDISLTKARNITGLAIQDNGTVTSVGPNIQGIMSQLVEQFGQYSGPLVKNTLAQYMHDEASTSHETTTVSLSEFA